MSVYCSIRFHFGKKIITSNSFFLKKNLRERDCMRSGRGRQADSPLSVESDVGLIPRTHEIMS